MNKNIYPLSRGRTELPLNVDLPREVADALTALCEKNKLRKKQVVEVAIRKYLKELSAPKK